MPRFDPGPGWRELEPDERYPGPRRDQLMWTGTRIGDTRYWVREELGTVALTSEEVRLVLGWHNVARTDAYDTTAEAALVARLEASNG